MHVPVAGSGTQVVNCPFWVGSPSAPGYVPKYWSKLRFSCMITTTCWILWIPLAAGGMGDGVAAAGLAHAAAARAVIESARTRTFSLMSRLKPFGRDLGITETKFLLWR